MTSRTDRPQVLVQARRVDDLLSVPSVLGELMAGDEALASHLALAERYEQAVAKATELARSLEQVRRDDDERRRATLVSGKRPAKPQAPDVEEALSEGRHDVELLASAIRESMVGLATRAVAFTDRAAAELERRREASIDRLRDLFRAAESAIEETAILGAQSVWVGQLRLSGRVTGYRPDGQVQALPRTAEVVHRLTLGLEEDLRRQSEFVAAREREAEAELPLPPGARVWTPGRPDAVVDESGKIVEDAEEGP